jgi:two-component system sensor histidine kinase MprB
VTRLRHYWPRVRALPLRSRLALMTAAAVAVAVAAVAVAAWFFTKGQLTRELDDSLRNTQLSTGFLAQSVSECSTSGESSSSLPPVYVLVQIVQPDGTACVAPGSKAVKVTSADIAVARSDLVNTTHDSTTGDGQQVRVFTYRQRLPLPDGSHEEIPVTLSRPLNQVTDPLERLALILTLVAAIGVVGSATAGLVVARAGLRPVDRLTDAVEHIARTEDLAVRIPVEGEGEIARLSTAFNSMTARLASSRERQQQLIADAGHELRTPLTSLRTNIDLLARSEQTGRPIPPDDRKALMLSVKAQMTELADLIGDLQELSRPDASPGAEPVRFVAVHEVAEQAVNRARLRGPGLDIRARLAPWYMRAEPAALERALVNLLDNAVKFSPAGGTVDVELVHGRFTVRDHGPGIPEDELPHVFERFWRSPSARSLPGSGLGLSIVAITVKRCGGTVDLRPAEGGGTLAVVGLPGAPTLPPGVDPDE